MLLCNKFYVRSSLNPDMTITFLIASSRKAPSALLHAHVTNHLWQSEPQCLQELHTFMSLFVL